jgi:dihydropteroate synthase
MGIINSTPDSFYAGSRFTGTDAVLSQCERMIHEGADIIDIGGQSTRPGSEPVSAEEELKRVIKSIDAIHRNFPGIYISVDTYYALVAKESVAAGASIINDISAGSMDRDFIDTVASLKVPCADAHERNAFHYATGAAI